MTRSLFLKIHDSLYGDVNFGNELSNLIWSPQIQRLRHIRLSNIDSFEMPGIANISRYEHSLGTCYLSSRVQLMKTMSRDDALSFQAAALLHDWDTTPFGHLIGEALTYVSAGYEHERQLSKIVEDKDVNEFGGLNRQMIYGRQMNIRKWATHAFGHNNDKAICEISQYMHGKGKYGKLISSVVDLDNLDNVTRIAYHMGLPVDRLLPIRVAENML